MTNTTMMIEVDAWTVCVCGHTNNFHEELYGQGRGRGCRVVGCQCKDERSVMVVQRLGAFSVNKDKASGEHALSVGQRIADMKKNPHEKLEGYCCDDTSCEEVENVQPVYLGSWGDTSRLYCPIHMDLHGGSGSATLSPDERVARGLY